MNQEHDYLKTSIWYGEEIPNPYDVIAEFFHDSDLPTHREVTADILLAACSERIYDREPLGDLLLQLKFVESVINAAYILNKE